MKVLATYNVLALLVTVLLSEVASVDHDPTTYTKYGLELDHPGTSCADIYEKNPASHDRSGLYVIKTNTVQLVYCDMSLECGSHKGGWMRIADLNTSRDNCPPGWTKNSQYRSLCTGGSAGGCYSAHFTTDGTKFSRVCGMMKGYQKGSTNAFYPYSYATFGPHNAYRPAVTVSTSLDGVYVDGVSITYSNPRKHIWTYAVGLSEDYNYKYRNCPCTKHPGPSPPPYIGNDYYCESGNPGTFAKLSALYSHDPLWDGYNCPSENNCCNRPGMPWFFQQLPVKESASSIEVRICRDESFANEGVAIEQLRLYIK